jgi:UPF0716 family protein affecting phage T7 exclusion
VVSYVKKVWHSIKRGAPGSRFKEHYRRSEAQRKSNEHRGLYICLGVLLMIAGALLSIPPGIPGFLVVILGAAIVASRSLKAAHAFDRLERFARRTISKITRKGSREPATKRSH